MKVRDFFWWEPLYICEDENKNTTVEDSTFETRVMLHDLDELAHGLDGLNEQTPPWENFNKDWMLMSPVTAPQIPDVSPYASNTPLP